MKIKYGIINGQKPVDLEADVDIGSELTENKDLENFTRDEFSTFAEGMTVEVSERIAGLGNGAESYVEFPHGLISKTPVRNFEELEEAFRTDFELYKDVNTGKLKGFGTWRPTPKTKKRRR